MLGGREHNSPEALVVHLGAEHLLLVQADGAEGAQILLSVWTRHRAQVLGFTCSSNTHKGSLEKEQF